MNATEAIMRFLSALIFAGLGYVGSRRIPPESKITAGVFFVLGAALASDTLKDVRLIAVDNYAIYLNSSLYGLGLGVFMGFLAKGKFHRPGTDTEAKK